MLDDILLPWFGNKSWRRLYFVLQHDDMARL